jgi:hypothetical protein
VGRDVELMVKRIEHPTAYPGEPEGMQMRIQFRHFQLLLYRKDFKDSSYSFQKFSKMMSEN